MPLFEITLAKDPGKTMVKVVNGITCYPFGINNKGHLSVVAENEPKAKAIIMHQYSLKSGDIIVTQAKKSRRR